ncbi:hypothetical protein ACWG0P_04645 [Amedibacillus sp. YH-ame6]
MKKLCIIILCLSFLYGCQNKPLTPDTFKESSEIFIFHKNINDFSDSLPNENQHFTFEKLEKQDSQFIMTYQVKEVSCLQLNFDENEQLKTISFGNIENIDGYQYSKLGILPSALILSIMYSDIEEENLDTIAKFLSEPFSSDKQMKLEDNKIDSTISISKDIKKQIITLVIE